MARKKMDSLLSSVKVQHLGRVYRLIEQFDLISRIDLSKLSGFVPASITALTRDLIGAQFIMERTSQSTVVRGRPAMGLCISPFYWQTLCATLTEDRLDIVLCDLTDEIFAHQQYTLMQEDFLNLEQIVLNHVLSFAEQNKDKISHLLAFSIAVAGQLDKEKQTIRLGTHYLNLDLNELFEPYFKVPVIVSEYFKDWVAAESTLGSAINCNDVLFLQLDDVINLSVLLQGQFLQTDKQIRMNINRVNLPKVTPWSEQINQHLSEIEKYEFQHQLTHEAIYQLIDLAFPNNALENTSQKINFLCTQANENNESAVKILHHLADSLSYVLMNLVNMFSSEKIVISSSLLGAKKIFLERLNKKLNENLLLDELHVEIATSKYPWNSAVVANSAIKQCLYDGSLLAHVLVS
ncbi:transcriptional regulator of PTS gene [Cricetibacter osteomyelitidis]|uniref:Transcriptional regulator of PTS protein n=1 Tax=Cricetibacter osteomyelitidis TaxID=1521931 RepID=A0A4R2SSA9_9PAST|nr:ROK family protein [Cricetibacter osteomyelitidis]TCP92230.1 transcriptional regulator of PTS gene [Cricetibacter osteomyelitidis]